MRYHVPGKPQRARPINGLRIKVYCLSMNYGAASIIRPRPDNLWKPPGAYPHAKWLRGESERNLPLPGELELHARSHYLFCFTTHAALKIDHRLLPYSY